MTRPAVDDDRLLSVAAVPGSARGRVTVEVDGEVDSYTAPLLEACLDTQTRRPGLRTLVVDLARVRFLGATGAAVIARAHARCAERGARLVVRCPQGGIVGRTLQVTGVADLVGPLDPAPGCARRVPGRRPRRRPRRREHRGAAGSR
jgi:anti-anti-sigma factor